MSPLHETFEVENVLKPEAEAEATDGSIWGEEEDDDSNASAAHLLHATERMEHIARRANTTNSALEIIGALDDKVIRAAQCER